MKTNHVIYAVLGLIVLGVVLAYVKDKDDDPGAAEEKLGPDGIGSLGGYPPGGMSGVLPQGFVPCYRNGQMIGKMSALDCKTLLRCKRRVRNRWWLSNRQN